MKRVVLIIIVAIVVASCYKSELCNLYTGKVVVNKLLPDDATYTDDGFTILFNGESYTSTSITTTLDAAIEPGTYVIYVYNNVTEMDIEHDIDEHGTGTITTSKVVDAGMVKSLTEDLYFGTQTITVLADQIIYSDVHLIQETRTINFNLLLAGGDIDKIKSVTATLGGIAQQWECIEDTPIGDGVEIEVEFTQGESLVKSDESNNYLTGSIKVLGVIGEEQNLNLVLTFINGNTQSITSSVGDQLFDSNHTKSTPITLTGELTLYTEFSSTGTITDWVNSGNDTTFDAEQPE